MCSLPIDAEDWELLEVPGSDRRLLGRFGEKRGWFPWGKISANI